MRRLSLQPASFEDSDFLFHVYASGRAQELAALPWTKSQKSEFLTMQFSAQSSAYQIQFPDLIHSLILDRGVPIGRLLVERRESEIRLVDLCLLPEHRGQGIGTELIGQLIQEACETQLPLRLHVEAFNPARRLYDRLGFLPLADRGVYIEMEWRPPNVKSPVPTGRAGRKVT